MLSKIYQLLFQPIDLFTSNADGWSEVSVAMPTLLNADAPAPVFTISEPAEEALSVGQWALASQWTPASSVSVIYSKGCALQFSLGIRIFSSFRCQRTLNPP